MTAESDNVIISSRTIDYSKLVGREIQLKTEQFAGRFLSTKVMAITDGNLILDRSGSAGRINQLIANQNIEVLFDYKGEPVGFTSKVIIPRPGWVQIPIAEEVSPRVRRRYIRFPIARTVKLTFFDDTNVGYFRLSKLKWMETSTMNVSGGGALVKIPVYLSRDDYMVINIDMEEINMPSLLVARVRHKRRGDNNSSLVGVEFMVKEDCPHKLPRNLIKNLPAKLFDFDDRMRLELASILTEKFKDQIE